MSVSPPRQWPRGRWNELHRAVREGSIEHTIAVLSGGVMDIDHRTPTGYTPLTIAAGFGYSHIVSILLSNGANSAILDDQGFSALHVSAQKGHLAVTKLLVKAGAELEAKTTDAGATPLHLAAQSGRSEVMGVLIEAGANPNSRALDGTTPLYIASRNGQVDATKVLLRAKANPLLTFSSPWGEPILPLDVAALYGHLEIARELIEEHGIEGCGGASSGVRALQAAAENQQLEIMGMLTSAGVVDTGRVLRGAVKLGRESSVKFLLQQWNQTNSGERESYLETCDPSGRTPMLCSIQACRFSCSPRITRMLVDAGADTTTGIPVIFPEGDALTINSLLHVVEMYLCFNIVGGEDATERQLHSLEAMRRLLLRVEAVHAVSWLWVSDAPSATHAAAEGTGRATKTTSTPLIPMLAISRRRAGRPRVLLAALFRNSHKP